MYFCVASACDKDWAYYPVNNAVLDCSIKITASQISPLLKSVLENSLEVSEAKNLKVLGFGKREIVYQWPNAFQVLTKPVLWVKEVLPMTEIPRIDHQRQEILQNFLESG